MARLIDADALIEWLKSPIGFRTNCEDCTEIDCLDCIIGEAIKNAPTIEAKPVRHRRWVDRYGDKYDNHLYECSECKGKARYRFTRDELGREIAEQALDDYCPHCGVKMDGGAGK